MLAAVRIKNLMAIQLPLKRGLSLHSRTELGSYFMWAAQSLQSCLTLCDPMDYSPPGSSVHGILQTRIPEWVVISSSRGSSRQGSNQHLLCLLHWQATREALIYILKILKKLLQLTLFVPCFPRVCRYILIMWVRDI